MQRMLVCCAGVIVLVWLLSLAGASSAPKPEAGGAPTQAQPGPPVPDRTPPDVEAIVGGPSQPVQDPEDDRLHFTASNGCPCPKVSVFMRDLVQPVPVAPSHRNRDVIPPGYHSAMREVGIVLGGTCP